MNAEPECVRCIDVTGAVSVAAHGNTMAIRTELGTILVMPALVFRWCTHSHHVLARSSVGPEDCGYILEGILYDSVQTGAV